MNRDQARRDSAAPLVLAVEARRLLKEVRGIGRYVRALLPRFLEQRPGLRIILFVRSGDIDAVPRAFEDLMATGRLEVRPARLMAKTPAGVYWYPWNVTTGAPRTGVVVATMHDVAPLALPDPRLTRWQKNWRWRRLYSATAKRATLIIADSRFTANEVHRVLGVPHARMRVVLLAADDVKPSTESDVDAVLARLGVTRPFVLTVGANDERKNLGLVERAMPIVRATRPDVILAQAGPRRRKQDRNHSWQHTLGLVTDDELNALYRTADCLVMPSRYEGFGLPMLEAMQLGTAVIGAHTSSLTEVGGDAVIWIDPDDVNALAAAIIRVLSDEGERARMSAAGRARAREFRWDDTTRRTLAAFDDAIAL